ncbi:MAG TPA: hypothetical protein V6D06_08125 [Trichocoleus sp.]
MPSLRKTLLADSFVCLVCGAALLTAASPLSDAFVTDAVSVLGYSLQNGLSILGAGVLGVGLYVCAISCARQIPPAAVWPVIGIEIGWVVGSLMLLVWLGHLLSWLGVVFVASGAVAVFGFMVLELMGLQHLSSTTSERNK